LFAVDIPLQYGDIHAQLRPEAVATLVTKNPAGKWGGGVFNLYTDGNWNYGPWRVEFKGECSAYDPDPRAPKPLEMNVPNTRPVDCLTREGYVEYGTGDLSLSAGKRTLEFSQALLTSPANPSMAALTLSSPLAPQEGLWGVQAKYVLNSEITFQAGAAFDVRASTFLVQPYGKFKWSFDALDVFVTGAEKFLGLGVNGQVTPNLLVYAEGNAHIPAKETFDLSKTRSDILVGASFSPPLIPWTFTGEYFLNSNGIGGGASPARLASGGAKIAEGRASVYDFVTTTSHASGFWGASDFLSRNLLFLNVRTNGDDSGPILTAVGSLDDFSVFTNIGYAYRYNLNRKKTQALWFSLEWRSFHGPADSEFEQAAKSVGRDRFLFTITFKE
jgi:hypothetical protein